jgi:hypothetical protein
VNIRPPWQQELHHPSVAISACHNQGEHRMIVQILGSILQWNCLRITTNHSKSNIALPVCRIALRQVYMWVMLVYVEKCRQGVKDQLKACNLTVACLTFRHGLTAAPASSNASTIRILVSMHPCTWQKSFIPCWPCCLNTTQCLLNYIVIYFMK